MKVGRYGWKNEGEYVCVCVSGSSDCWFDADADAEAGGLWRGWNGTKGVEELRDRGQGQRLGGAGADAVGLGYLA